MNKKWSSDKVKDVQRWLVKRWPESFAQGPDLRPLSLQIHKEILEHRDEYPQLSGRVVREVLKRHTTSYGYLYGSTKHDKRYNLKGEAVGLVSGEQREWARSTLKAKQKEAQKIRKEARQKLKEQRRTQAPTAKKNATIRPAPHGLANRVSASRSSESNGPVIKYKTARRRIVKPDTERTVEIAS